MKILFVSSGKKDGKPGPIIQSQATSIENLGVITKHYIINEKGIQGYLRECYNLRKLISKENYDIIHAHYGLTAIVCLLARRNEKLVVSFMGDDIIGSNKADGRITRISMLLAKINGFFARWFYDYSIVKSLEMQNRLNTNKLMLIPNGVDISIFKSADKFLTREKLGYSKSDSLIIFVSNPARVEKNFKLAKDAVDLINNQSIKLVIVNGYDQSRLVDYYNAADVLLLTSFHEGSPNVIKEAMASNCPIVSTNVGDVEWVIGEIEGCYLAELNPLDFAEKINLSLNFAKKIGRTEGRERIIQLGLDSATIARRIIKIYKKVLE